MDFLLNIPNETLIWILISWALLASLLLYESIASLHDRFETIKFIFLPPFSAFFLGSFFFSGDTIDIYAILISATISFIVYLNPKVKKHLDQFPIPDPTYQSYDYRTIKIFGLFKLTKSYLPLIVTSILLITKIYFICFMFANPELAVQYTFVENNIISVCAGLLLGRSLRFLYYHIK